MVLKKVAVTGASGMVGRHLLSLLSQRDIAALATSRTRPRFLPQNSTWAFWDLSEWKSNDELDRLFPNVQALFHLGACVPQTWNLNAETRRAIFDINVRSCLSIAEWALAKHIPIVFLSSSMVYANPERIDIKECDPKTDPGRDNFYGFGKWVAEQVFSCFSQQGVEAVIFRPSSIYGNGLPSNKMITRFLNSAAQGEVINLKPPFEEKVNLIHAMDVATAMIQALEREAWGTFNISGTAPCSIREIAETCVKVVGGGSVRLLDADSQTSSKERFGLSCEAARRAFGFSSKIDLFRGLKIMWEDMLLNHKDKEYNELSDSLNMTPGGEKQ